MLLFAQLFKRYLPLAKYRNELSPVGQGEDRMVREMKILGLVMDKESNSAIIVLKDLESDAALPISIGLLEATNIAIKLENIVLSRPMTHDLLKNMMDQLGVEVDRVEIADLINDTFYAWVCLRVNEKKTRIDARPSDALAIALRTGSQIHVNEKLIERHNIAMTRNETETLDDEAEKWTEILENLTPEDFHTYRI
jgi:bifunctional DNase/RNase